MIIFFFWLVISILTLKYNRPTNYIYNYQTQKLTQKHNQNSLLNYYIKDELYYILRRKIMSSKVNGSESNH